VPIIAPALHVLHGAIEEWFPLSNKVSRLQLAFALAHDVLQVAHVEGETWMASISVDPAGPHPTDGTLVDQIYATLRCWYRHHPAAVSRKLADVIVHDVLHANHVLGELWSLRIASQSSADHEGHP